MRRRRRALSASACRSGCRDDFSLPSAPRARTPHRGVLAACCAWRAAAVPRQGDGGGTRVSPRRRDRKPAPLSVERRPPRDAPAVPQNPLAAVRGSARRRAVGDASTRRAAQETLALNPTKAGSAISRIVLSFRAKGAIVPAGCAAPAAALPLARTSRCARKRGFGWGCAYQASSTSTSRLCLLVGAAGGARPRGAARRRFLSGVGGRACDAAPRGPWSPGDRRTRMRGA